jgi:hypothetical protein
MLLGLLLLQNARYRFADLEGGYFGDVFHMSIVPEAWVPSRGGYELLLALQLVGAALAVVGFFGRECLAIGASIGLFLLCCDRLQYHNNRFALLLVCLLCAFTPSDRSFLLYRGRRHALPPEARLGPTLPRRLLQLQISAIYLSSGIGKLLDPDWRGGQTNLVRFQGGLRVALERGFDLPQWYADFVSSPLVASLTAKGAISLELFLAVGLWLPRTRAFALWAGAVFHVAIQATLRVELFSWLMGACYVAFATPELRERRVLLDSSTRVGRALKRALPWFDWLSRFRIEEQAGGVVVIDRDGHKARGRAVPAGPILLVFSRVRPRLTDP